jgi:hypothetical protein
MFQRQFTSQLAMTAFASHFLMLSKGAPHTMLFELNTGTSSAVRQRWCYDVLLCSSRSLFAFTSAHMVACYRARPFVSGNVIPWEVSANYNAQGMLIAPEPVPFRLTPNLVNFISPVGITGLFSASLIASAQVNTARICTSLPPLCDARVWVRTGWLRWNLLIW